MHRHTHLSRVRSVSLQTSCKYSTLKNIDYFAIVSEMAAKIILTSQPSSAKFTDRVLLLDQETVKVSRSTTEEKPDTYNAVFDCRVRKMLSWAGSLAFNDLGFVKSPGRLQFQCRKVLYKRHGEHQWNFYQQFEAQ